VSRSALAVAGALFALGILVWFLTGGDDSALVGSGLREIPAAATSAPLTDAVLAPPAAPAEPAGRIAQSGPFSPAQIIDSDGFIRALDARGLDGEKLVAAYRDWRIARGYLGPDPLAGVPADGAPSLVYAGMDRSTQKALADTGDLGAIQAYAAGSLPADPVAAVEYYGKAAALGSAAAMVEMASILAAIGDQQPGGPGDDPTYPQRLLALRGGDPARNLRLDAMAWALAAIRQHGPVVATPAGLALTADLVRNPDKSAVATVCGRSLAILADLSAATAGQDTGSLPPVFLAEKDLYEKLPCRETPAPVMPPRALERCAASPAMGSGNRPVDLWVCEEN